MENRETISRRQAEYNKSNKDTIRQYRTEYNQKNKEGLKAKQNIYNERNKEVIKQKESFRRMVAFKNFDEKDRYKKFIKDIQEGLNYTCICCHRTFFKSSIQSGSLNTLQQKINSKTPGLFERCISLKHEGCQNKVSKIVHVCTTCFKYLVHKGQMPPLSYFNGLQLDDIPQFLKMNELEQTLVAKELIFLKTFKLPVSRWSAVKDRVVNVPITDNDLLETLSQVNSVPRRLDKSGLIPVKLKRRLSYKNIVNESYIDPVKMINALKYFRERNHPAYQEIDIDESYQFMHNIDALELDSEGSASDTSDEEQDFNQYTRQESTMLTDDCPEGTLVLNSSQLPVRKKSSSQSRNSISLAPGEGKIPTNILRNTQWDVNAFPSLHPTGKYGLNFKREKKIGAQQYFLQRLMNADKRFSKTIPYIFSALYYIEREQFERQINISFQRGCMRDGQLLSIEDGFSVFDKIPGTPRYWQQRRYDMIAKIEQLGAFQFFFTAYAFNQ